MKLKALVLLALLSTLIACEQKEDKVQEELGPGLRLFSLLDNGQISTNVQRLPKHKTSQL